MQPPDLNPDPLPQSPETTWIPRPGPGRPGSGSESPTVPPTVFDSPPTVVSGQVRSAANSHRPVSDPVLRRFGDYELLNEVARGGMGVVYRARQIALDRQVALKMILQGGLASEEDVLRFRQESEAAARLDHPGIVPIHEVGCIDGQHFFTMGFIEGESLQQRVQRGPLAPRAAAELVQRLAEAVGYAHRQGVVHRDLKPANVLLDRQGEPRVTDFGLARNVDKETGLTQSGAIMGTPSYMPPEQASGLSSRVGPSADIYSLGAVLYCLLTGRPPFQSANPLETLRQVIEGEPVPPRHLNPAIDADLEAICLKCLEKRPDDRYHSATALQEELTRFLNGEAVSIRTRPSLERLRRTLIHSRDDQELATWGDLLLLFAPVVLGAELVIWWVADQQARGECDRPFLWAGVVRIVQFGLLLACGWRLRERLLQSRRAVARQMWSHWAAFAIACHLVLVVRWIPIWQGAIDQQTLTGCYPYFAIFSGTLWFTLGSNFWGGCYVFGTLHFLAALFLARFPESGPACFGGVWFLSLVVTGRRLKRLQLNRPDGNPDSRS